MASIPMKNLILDVVKSVDKQVKSEPSLDVKESSASPASSAATREIDYSTIKTVNKWKAKTDTNDWNNLDFARYMIHLYSERLHARWDVYPLGLTVHMGRIKEKLKECVGFCDNIVFRDYIDYFFREWAGWFRRRFGDVKMHHFRSQESLTGFCADYDYHKSFFAESHKAQATLEPIESEGKVSAQKVELAYKLGLKNLLLEFGIVVATNWLIKKKGATVDDAFNMIVNAISNLYFSNKKAFTKVVDMTNWAGPYPIDLPMQDFRQMENKLAAQKVTIELHPEFSNKEVSWF